MLRPFVPSQDHAKSRAFYEALGFTAEYADDRIAVMSNGTDSFILQDFFVKDLAENLVLQLVLPDVAAWWAAYNPAHIAEQFGTNPPAAPILQPWGRIVGFIHDPCGVLWHVTQA